MHLKHRIIKEVFMLTLVLMEFKKLKRSRILYTVLGTMFLFYLCAAAQGIKSNYSAEKLMYEILVYATFLIVPALFSLLGSYMISREAQEDTLKSLLIVPVSRDKLVYVKLLSTLIIGLLLLLFLFIFTLIGVWTIHRDQITVVFIVANLKKYLLQAIGCFAAVLPIIIRTTRMKNGYLLSVLFAEIYAFTGLIAASSKYRNVYPISAVLGFSGVEPTTGSGYLICCSSLLVCVVAALILQVLRKTEYD